MRFFIAIFLVSLYCSYGQKKHKFQVLDSVNSLPISDAFVLLDGKLVTSSNNNGVFEIDSITEYSQLQISHIGYKPYFISKEEIENKKIAYLKENYYELKEFVITNESNVELILPSLSENKGKLYNEGFTANEATYYATYIPNKQNKSAKINSVIIETDQSGIGDSNKQYMPFKVNLYSVNEETFLPDFALFDESILAYKTMHSLEKYVKIDISEYNQDFPVEGIFVLVETLTITDYQAYSNISAFPPSFKTLKRNKNSTFRTFERVYNSRGNIMLKDWVQEPYPETEFIFNFGLKVEYK